MSGDNWKIISEGSFRLVWIISFQASVVISLCNTFSVSRKEPRQTIHQLDIKWQIQDFPPQKTWNGKLLMKKINLGNLVMDINCSVVIKNLCSNNRKFPHGSDFVRSSYSLIWLQSNWKEIWCNELRESLLQTVINTRNWKRKRACECACIR